SSLPHSPTAASNLPAHQQSIQLFNKYLERQQYQWQQQQQQQHDNHLFQYQHLQHSQLRSTPYLYKQQHQDATKGTEATETTGECFLQFQVPPPELNTSLPHGIAWGLQQHGHRHDDGDDQDQSEIDDEVEDMDEDEADGDADEDDEEEAIRVFLKTSKMTSSSPSYHPQLSEASAAEASSAATATTSSSHQETPQHSHITMTSQQQHQQQQQQHFVLGWPQTIEPAKTVAIDMWRRSLMRSPQTSEPANVANMDGKRRDSIEFTTATTAATATTTHLPKVEQQHQNDHQGSINVVADPLASPVSLTTKQNRLRWPLSFKDPYIRPRLTTSWTGNSGKGRALDGGVINFGNSQQRKRLLHAQAHGNDNLPRDTFIAYSDSRGSYGGESVSEAGSGIAATNTIPAPATSRFLQRQHQSQNPKDARIQESEAVHAAKTSIGNTGFFSRWQKAQPSSTAGSATNRDSLTALPPGSPGSSRNSFPSLLSNRDSDLANFGTTSHRDRGSFSTSFYTW
ncbi:hypothetical protein BGZ65_009592, partial [Modicella reniformis]